MAAPNCNTQLETVSRYPLPTKAVPFLANIHEFNKGQDALDYANITMS